MRRGILLVLLFIAGYVASGAPAEAGRELTFTRVDAELGIDVQIPTYGPNWGDFDADGYEDCFSTNHGSLPTLFHNQGGAGFVDVIEESWIQTGGDQHGAVWGDIDNDGLRDLYTILGAPGDEGTAWNQLNWNVDGMHFVDIARPAGVTDSTGRGRYGCLVDIDCDGWLDIFVGNYATPNRLYLNQGDRTFVEVPGAGGLGDTYLRLPSFTDLNDDGFLDLLLADPETYRLALYENMGDGTFLDRTAGSGLPAGLAFVWSACWLDYDNDGDQDVYLSRGYWPSRRDCYALEDPGLRFQTYMPDWPPDFENGIDGLEIEAPGAVLECEIRVDKVIGANEHIYLGKFGEHPDGNQFTVTDGQFLGTPEFVPGTDLGCYIWQDSLGGVWHLRTSTNFNGNHRFWGEIELLGGTITAVDTFQVETEFVDSSLSDGLFRNNGNGTFSNVSGIAGIGDQQSGKTVTPADFDNDGWMDLYVVNDRNVSGPLAYNDANLLYMNDGDGSFTECAIESGVACMVGGTGSAAAWGDYNNDGFADLYVTNGWVHFPFHTGPHVVYRNEGNANRWVKIRLVGTVSNRDAIGARVRILAGGQAQYRVQNGGIVDMGQSSMDLLFGLGDATMVDSLTVWWPSGHIGRYGALAANATHMLVELDPQGDWTDIVIAAEPRLLTPAPNPFASATLLRYYLPTAADADLTIYDASGRRVCQLARGLQGGGLHTARWDGRDQSGRLLSGGIYFGRLRANDQSCERRLVLIR